MTLVAFDVDRMYSDEVQTHIFRDGGIKVMVPNTGINKIETINSKQDFKIYIFMVGKCFNANPLIRWLKTLPLDSLKGEDFRDHLVNFWADRAMRFINDPNADTINFILVPELELCYRLHIEDGRGVLNFFSV